MEIIGVWTPILDGETVWEVCVNCATEEELSKCDVITKDQAEKSDMPLFCHRCERELYEMKDTTAIAKAEILLSRAKRLIPKKKEEKH